MKRSRFRISFLKDKTESNRENYKTQETLAKKLLKTTKKSYFDTLNTKKNYR